MSGHNGGKPEWEYRESIVWKRYVMGPLETFESVFRELHGQLWKLFKTYFVYVQSSGKACGGLQFLLTGY